MHPLHVLGNGHVGPPGRALFRGTSSGKSRQLCGQSRLIPNFVFLELGTIHYRPCLKKFRFGLPFCFLEYPSVILQCFNQHRIIWW